MELSLGFRVRGRGAGKRFNGYGFLGSSSKIRILGFDRVLGNQASRSHVRSCQPEDGARRRFGDTRQTPSQRSGLRNAPGGRTGTANERQWRDAILLLARVPRET